ncbi:cation:proton antiporter domain-containing protein [Halapricum hydrolyticum]|uniref:Cation:proton antiporter n=1 Tax=Halapricum hydrolyticum TaxID=2979991 RepID=A0AAE3LF05_9EURY|nr:cation:proton antiporter [Halapricum hydrolyticum]MCU4717721.1 cation:proton antiporter [Halapricum hydrolyticum]MCU4726750.1 cation:proton antiporter [Halapricum hydrolyticum]
MSSTVEIITVVTTIAGLGVGSKILADRLQVPSVLFLILTGIVVGPEGIGLVTPAVFGGASGALPAIVGLSVAIIVFEGAFSLEAERLREAPRVTLRLVTVGAVVTLVGTTVVVHYLLGAAWDVSLLVGSLLVATGPTVITPIMDVVMVRERVASALETEGVVNDVTAAILAVVTFEYVVLSRRGVERVVSGFLLQFGTGIAVGIVVALLAWVVLRRLGRSDNGPQNARLIVLVTALIAYGAAESSYTLLFSGIVGTGHSEAGIAAVAAGGFVLGNLDIPYREAVEQFKGDVTLLVNSFVFITLASLLSLSDLQTLGLAGLAAAVLIAAAIRPLAVMLCTVGDTFSLRERAFMSAMGPRGIIPASVATLFALELNAQSPAAQNPEATTLVGMVFLVIVLTVVFEGGGARHIAQALNVIPKRVLIVGGGRIGQELADRLEDRDEEVVIVDSDPDVVERLRGSGYTVRQGDATDRGTLEDAGIENAKIVAVATGDDDVNMLVSQLAKNRFDVERVIARVNEPTNTDAFEDLDVETVPSWRSVAWSMDNFIERPAIARWMTELDETGDVQEIEVTDSDRVGMTVAQLSAELPDGAHLALVSRDGNSQLPHPDQEIERGDHLTFIGRPEPVQQAVRLCEQ